MSPIKNQRTVVCQVEMPANHAIVGLNDANATVEIQVDKETNQIRIQVRTWERSTDDSWMVNDLDLEIPIIKQPEEETE